MGNLQSGGTQFCSSGELYINRSEMTNFKLDTETRVGYSFSKPNFQVQRIQKPYQQIIPQKQQIQEEVEIPLAGPGKCKIPKSFFGKQEAVVGNENKKPSFNVYISCLQEEESLYKSKNTNNGTQEVEGDIVDYYMDDLPVFDGFFGNIIINKKGLVLYTDCTGTQHCEEFDRETVEKIFPMGISFGGLTKSIWFKDGVSRDEAFEVMISIPPSYKAVMANPTKYAIKENKAVELADSENMKTFEGHNNTDVIVHSNNMVRYIDLNKKWHCVAYCKYNIRKCFPHGICNGGLPKAIWFNDEMERDLCFMLMRWNIIEDITATPGESPTQKFTGLNGDISLHSDSQIEYTSLTGDIIKCFFEPTAILETFPLGISFGRLPKTIWFREVEEREKCIEAMRKM